MKLIAAIIIGLACLLIIGCGDDVSALPNTESSGQSERRRDYGLAQLGTIEGHDYIFYWRGGLVHSASCPAHTAR
jgi:hypothetical protein